MFPQCLSEVDINSATVKQAKILNEFAVFLRFCFDPYKSNDCGEVQELTSNRKNISSLLRLLLKFFDKPAPKFYFWKFE